jgi:hypothetical protein
MVRVATSGTIRGAADWAKLLKIASALIALGVLPKTWQKGIAAASAVLFLLDAL